jgi:hypothetical protein
MRPVVAGGALPDTAWKTACGRIDLQIDDLRARRVENAVA